MHITPPHIEVGFSSVQITQDPIMPLLSALLGHIASACIYALKQKEEKEQDSLLFLFSQITL